jgi:SPP1 gp7 family putative phage head morphogenesis protein
MFAFDDYHADGLFDAIFDAARNNWANVSAALTQVARRVASQVERTVNRSINRQVEQQDLSLNLARGFLPFGEIQGQVDDFVRQNAALIKDIGEQAARNIEREVIDAVAKGTSTKKLAKLIKEQQEMATNRAKLIARDQIGKLNGQLNKTRQKAAGFEKYQWQTMQDKRVRPTHQDLNGSIRTWGEGIEPGEEVQCRCSAIPVWED